MDRVQQMEEVDQKQLRQAPRVRTRGSGKAWEPCTVTGLPRSERKADSREEDHHGSRWGFATAATLRSRS